MNRQQFLARTGLGLAALIAPNSVAGGQKQELVVVENNIALEYWADTAGDQNGCVTRIEEHYLHLLFAQTDEFYVITTPPADASMPPEMSWHPADLMVGFYVSEKQLKQENNGVVAEFPVGILRVNKEGQITGAWTTDGDLGNSQWNKEDIPVFDYGALMKQRKMQRFNVDW